MKHTRESTAIINFGQFRHHWTTLIGGGAWFNITSGKEINFGLPKGGDCMSQSNLLFIRRFQFKYTSGMMLFGKSKGLDLKWFSCSRGKEKSWLLGPPFCSQVGGKTRLWKNHSINLLLFFSMQHLLSRVLLARYEEFCASRSAIHSN